MLLEGVHVPLTTPFYPDGRVYLRKLEHNVRRLSLTPVSGLIALGPNSESYSLSTDEKRSILTTVAATASPEKVLIAGIAEAGVHPALALADHAAEHLFDAILLSAPPSQDIRWWHGAEPTPELLTWFRAIADRSSLPVILAGGIAATHLPARHVAQLADHPNIVALLQQSTHVGQIPEVKAATAHIRHEVTTTTTFNAATQRMLLPAPPSQPSGSLLSAASLASGGTAIAIAPVNPPIKTRSKQVGFQILWSLAHDSTAAFRAGASGFAPQVAASIPGAVFEIWAAWRDGDAALMREKEARVVEAEPYLLETGISAIKAAAELSGYFGGRPRLPQLPPTADVQDRIASLLSGMRS